MSDQGSEVFLKVLATLREFREKLTELSNTDLSGIHVHHEWSWIPYVKDHLDFLVEQAGGLSDNLRDSPPPTEKNLSEENT